MIYFLQDAEEYIEKKYYSAVMNSGKKAKNHSHKRSLVHSSRSVAFHWWRLTPLKENWGRLKLPKGKV